MKIPTTLPIIVAAQVEIQHRGTIKMLILKEIQLLEIPCPLQRNAKTADLLVREMLLLEQ